MNQKKKKGSGFGILIWLLVLLVGYLANNEDVWPMIRRYRSTLIPALIVLAVILLTVWIISRISSSIKERGREHTHDRIDTISYDVNESEEEHYRKQLNGFLKAGIIEKEEYRLLLQRYTGRR